jgi:hypothetical protein
MTDENTYAVFDTETRIILVFPQSYTTAVCVSRGMLNTEPILLPTSLARVGNELKQYNLDSDVLKLTPKQGHWVSLVPDHLITEQLMKQREIATLRSEYIYVLEQQFKIQNARSMLYFDEHVATYLIDEINKSEPMTDTYSKGIVEYASIQFISPAAAYQELKFMIESSGLIKIRNYAWFSEYVRKFNGLTTKEELQAEVKNSWQSLVLNAFI